jgi:hypothetical protein
VWFVVYMEKQKKKRIFKLTSPSAWAAALAEESFFAECLSCGARRRGFLPRVSELRRSRKRVSSPSAWAAALGKESFFLECCTRERSSFFFKKKKEIAPAGHQRRQFFSECTVFSSRRRHLSRKTIAQRLFRECYTRQRLLQCIRMHSPQCLASFSRQACAASCKRTTPKSSISSEQSKFPAAYDHEVCPGSHVCR